MNEIITRINQQCRGTLVESLGIAFIGMGEDWLEARMPIDKRTLRPGNLLHGGAIMALAETVGSGLSFVQASPEACDVYGIEINGNHVHQARGKYVTGRAEFIHKGKRTQVVAVRITDEFGALVSVCRVTNMLLPKGEAGG
ncbi:MAG: hotdog fold thioesterase [Odoribacteraceae bacterium]|jgi:uncharacterized protein (TIGR00369 family)|nr:hotdog fold thioesterase [Odoribacteraceae bacterium]